MINVFTTFLFSFRNLENNAKNRPKNVRSGCFDTFFLIAVEGLRYFLHFQLVTKSFLLFNGGLQNPRETLEACSGTVSRVSGEPSLPDTVTS